MGLLFDLSQEFEYSLAKTAAKDRLGRNKVNKALEKAKKEYANHKGNLDQLEAQDSKLRIQLDNTRKSTNDARKRVITLHKAMQNMDLANASDAVFYNDNSEDIGYIIGGKEYHLKMDEEGEMELVPMRHFRSERKRSLLEDPSEDAKDEVIEELNQDIAEGEEILDGADEPTQDELLSDDDLNILFQSLI